MKYLCVLDFEATCCQHDEFPRNEMEIIEFPIVVVDLEKLAIVDSFHKYIKPNRHPKLTKFCTDLTGITQEMLEDKPDFTTVFFGSELGLFMAKYGEESVIITCGDWDLRTMLPNQLKALAVSPNKIPSCFKRWLNVKELFQDFYKVKAGGMPNMLEKLKLELKGRHHSGIDDCKNIASICVKMTEDGYHFNTIRLQKVN